MADNFFQPLATSNAFPGRLSSQNLVVKVNPINIWPTCPAIIGQASAGVLASSVLNRRVSGIESR